MLKAGVYNPISRLGTEKMPLVNRWRPPLASFSTATFAKLCVLTYWHQE
jgi:hypothetical protein